MASGPLISTFHFGWHIHVKHEIFFIMADIQVDVGVLYQKSCSLTHISLYFLQFRMMIFMI